ncbi:GNAT family N-acetyltransferase [Mesorhizobium sp. ANAO-SY3R2]|uniref:GNAT family N-acetyltransferase n=1 Tax=Mesorhizobium sp. ANAO-SY3R2 TaxID=3166644 RepID=UPI003670CEAB
MPDPRRRPLLTPLAAAGLKPVFVDVADEHYRVRTLRPQEVTDEIATWLTDPAVMEGLNAPQKAMGLEAFRTYVASFDNLKRNLVAIRRRADDTALGLLVLEVDLRHRLGSLHVVIGDADSRGQKMAQHGSLLLVRHFFAERKLEKLTLQPLARNAAAIAVCEKCGLRLEGVLRAHRIDGRTGERLDQMLYAITKDEFEEGDRRGIWAKVS